jgi:hypothetical protein
MPDHGSPDPNPPLVDYYMQFWADGTGEGGFWDVPLTESHFFEWEINEGVISFTPDVEIFEDADYSYIKTDSSDYIFYTTNDSEITAINLSDDIVPRVDFSTDYIVGTWSGNFVVSYMYDAQGNIIATITENKVYTFTSDSLFREGFETCTWHKSTIPHVIEINDHTQWAVRTENQDTIICIGRNRILRKNS